MTNARAQLAAIRRRMRAESVPANSREAWQIICDVRGIDPHNPWCDTTALRLQGLFQTNERARPCLAASLAYDVLNGFGTLNPWRSGSRASWSRRQRCNSLRDRMRARGMVDVEPGNYLALKGHSVHMGSIAA